MNIDHYHKFLSHQELGLKKKASESVRCFVDSFESEDQIESWVWSHLPELGENRSSRVRHEIFHELVYPVLKSGYLADDFNSTLWLGKLIQNIYQTPKLHEELSWVSEMELLRKCNTIEPEDNEARLLLLGCIVRWLEYTEHEWPSGILYGNDGANEEQCIDIRNEVELVLRLDKEHKHSEFIKQYMKKLSQYQAGLNKGRHAD